MGICIQQHRAVIGSFNQVLYQTKPNRCDRSCRNKFKLKIAIAMTILIFIFSVMIPQLDSSSKNGKSVLKSRLPLSVMNNFKSPLPF